jgi:hypothetical protein
VEWNSSSTRKRANSVNITTLSQFQFVADEHGDKFSLFKNATFGLYVMASENVAVNKHIVDYSAENLFSVLGSFQNGSY